MGQQKNSTVLQSLKIKYINIIIGFISIIINYRKYNYNNNNNNNNNYNKNVNNHIITTMLL